ncbi:MAG: hypothetical protein LPK02_07545 [Rhodobacterales bacterium]|nr:hypothetical protein [Rhodobacterales bacterium]
MIGILLVLVWVAGTLTSYLMWDAAATQRSLGRSIIYAILSVVLLLLPLVVLINL